ncbi:unnamed protein product, partial [Cercopithifilaria johnstoni]
EEIVEVWDGEKVTPFEYPVKIFSEQCAGTAPLPLSKNISITCMPQWNNIFDEKHCIGLKYLNVSHYLRKYSTERDGNRTIVSMEGISEESHLIRWLYWNGTACINAVSQVLIKFITHNGLLDDILASVHYANITEQSYFQQLYQFDAIFIEALSTSNATEVKKPLGYDMRQIIRIDSTTNAEFSFLSGMECNSRNQQVNIRFGIQINTACRLRITTCAQILDQIQHLLNEWNDIIVYSLPYNTNETITMRNNKLLFTETNKLDESCELITAASIKFAYVRIGNIQSYSHRLISYEIELSLYTILYVVFIIESTTALGGIFALKALTGNMPYVGFGNPWITYPTVSYGGASIYSPYMSRGYGSNTFGRFGNTGIYYPYRQYFGSQSLIRNSLTTPAELTNSLTTTLSGGGRYYRGRGNPWITKQ